MQRRKAEEGQMLLGILLLEDGKAESYWQAERKEIRSGQTLRTRRQLLNHELNGCCVLIHSGLAGDRNRVSALRRGQAGSS